MIWPFAYAYSAYTLALLALNTSQRCALSSKWLILLTSILDLRSRLVDILESRRLECSTILYILDTEKSLFLSMSA